MAKRVIWSSLASNEKIKILEYWIDRNQSKVYSKKLNKLFTDAVNIIKDFPEIGRLTDFNNVRRFLVRDYLIFYNVEQDTIFILSI